MIAIIAFRDYFAKLPEKCMGRHSTLTMAVAVLMDRIF
jgi:hypothetical protein